MKKPSLNLTDFLIIAGISLGALALHQVVIAKRLSPKVK
jgi:hypothetical protein